MREFTLESMRVAFDQRVGESALQTMRLDESQDFLFGGMAHRLSAYVLSHHFASDTYTSSTTYPTSAWQHVKRDWFPTFSRLLRRPARTRGITLNVAVKSHLTFPESNWIPPDLGPHRFLQQATVRWDDLDNPIAKLS